MYISGSIYCNHMLVNTVTLAIYGKVATILGSKGRTVFICVIKLELKSCDKS